MTFKNHTIKFNNPVWVEDFDIQACSNQDLLDYFGNVQNIQNLTFMQIC